MISLILACIAFVGFHFLLSHPLRRSVVARVGEGPFLGIYSLISAATLIWMIIAYRRLPSQELAYFVGDVSWAVATGVMWPASMLFVGSLIGNPALPDPSGKSRPPTTARGVYAFTRHPMMWSFSIWSLIHIWIWPTGGNITISLTILVLALFGSLAQDRKKKAQMGADWSAWEARTSWLPFAALVQGRARYADAVPGVAVWLGGTLFWLAATWAHTPLGIMPAGIWRWIGR